MILTVAENTIVAAPRPPPFDPGKFTVAYVVNEAEAHALIDEIVADAAGGLIAADLETAPRPAEVMRMMQLRDTAAACRGKLAAMVRAKAGRAELAARKLEVKKTDALLEFALGAGLDPHRADIRLVQLYGGGRRVAVIDIARTGPAILQRLNDLRLVFHNAAFDLSFVALHAIEPAETHCTLQVCRLTLNPGSLSLASAALNYLGIELDKEQQTSDWAAEHLTARQVRYAALDAYVGWHVAMRALPALDRQASAYEIQMQAVPAAMRMKLRGLGFDAEAHDRLMVELRAEREVNGEAFAKACTAYGLSRLAEAGLRVTSATKEGLLTVLLTSDELAAWVRTEKSGHLSTKRTEMRRAAHYPPIAALIKLSTTDKLLSSFDTGLLSHVSHVTGRIHASYGVAFTASGRASCSKPNLQQMPRDKRFRALFKAAPGNVLVGADYALMEMRAAAHISADPVMTAALAAGADLHKLVAAGMLGKTPEEVTTDERKSAKAVNFGALYGQGARGLMASAWAQLTIVLAESEARAWVATFEKTYPTFVRWRREHARRCEDRRLIVIGRDAAEGIGRFFPRAWLPRDASMYTRACNLPIQGACADASMLALANIDRSLFEAGIDGGPVAWVHDEILLEVAQADAERAAGLLVTAMTDAFAETFPGAPTANLTEAKTGANWAAVKG